MPKKLIYAGIGSRKTPEDICYIMYDIAYQLAEAGWLLRSGHADGADKAFERGVIEHRIGEMEIFIPWFGFNEAPYNHPSYIRPKATQELADFSAQFHPNWNKCSDAAKLLHMRNACQILGLDGHTPVDMVICWTPLGLGTGGTGQALRIAQANNIPIFDLGGPDSVHERLVKFVEQKEAA